MTCPGVVVGDAGQAYEAIDVEKIHGCLDRLFAKLDASEKEGKRTCITVMRTQRSHVFFGGTATRRLWDRAGWYSSSIRRALEGFLGMRLFLVSVLVVQQLCGIPIGGPSAGPSSMPCSVNLSFRPTLGARADAVPL
eukprot:4232178-Pyramimonas_sp.AAC.1